MPDITTPFVALPTSSSEQFDIIAVDLGYSRSKRSCGIASPISETNGQFRFGESIEKVVEIIATPEHPLLVLEAPLSIYHNELGNPDCRSDFEKGRGWYHGAGATALAAAHRFIEQLMRLGAWTDPLVLAEAFLSNKSKRTRDRDDAKLIHDMFWKERPVSLNANAEPILPSIEGVPPVRSFRLPE